MRVLAIALLSAAGITLTALPAAAGSTEYKNPQQGADGGVTLVAERNGSVTQPTPRGGTLDCRIHDLRPDTTQIQVGDEAAGLQVDVPYWLICLDATGNRVVSRLFRYEPGVEVISPEDLAVRARSQLPLIYPEPRTSPAIALDQIPGIDTWLWVGAELWQPITATASIPGLSISATATPETMTWDMGDGTVVNCDGPGTPYDDGRPESTQSTDCSHVYQSRGEYTATATITWSIAWTASDGDGGQLADASRSTQFPMHVIEHQAVGR